MCPFSPQNKPSLSQETDQKRPTNPPQRVPAHKESQNVVTPPEMASRPPQG